MNNKHIFKNFTFKKAKTSIKRAWRKLKYLDRTQLNYFIVTGFIGLFCLSTAISYAAFVVSNTILNAVTIKIAKLNYTLQTYGTPDNTTVNCDSGTCIITVNAKSRGTVQFKLTSLNPITTRYAINYSNAGANTSVYYSQNLANNMSGTIGETGSELMIRLVLNNTNETNSENVTININGGYLQNTLTSNITEGYYERDLTIRAILMDSNFNITDTTQSTFPAKTSNYAYLKTECTEASNPVWSYNDWNLTINQLAQQISCDVYFKQMSNDTDIEIAYRTIDSNNVERYMTTAPTDTNYGYRGTTCSSNAKGKWDRTTNNLSITNTDVKTLCVVTFKYGEEDIVEKTSPIKCLDNNGDEMECPAASNLSVGQRIAIGDQVFRYIRTTNTSDTETLLNECADGAASIACTDADSRHPLADKQLRLLAEYNLNVGSNKNANVTEGIQDESVKGYVPGETTYGNISFGSSTSYAASNVKTYVEAYASTLNTTYFGGENVVSGSAITKAEIMNLCSLSGDGTCANTYPWVYTTSYLSGSAYDDDLVWFVDSNGFFSTDKYRYDDYFGVRAVISISASLI